MIPMPPSHCVNCRHISSERSSGVDVGEDGRAGRREAGHRLEVGVDAAGRAGGSPESRYGSAPNAAATSHVSATTRKPSRKPSAPRSGGRSARAASPPPAASAPATRKGQKRLAVADRDRAPGGGRRPPRYLTSVPTRPSAARDVDRADPRRRDAGRRAARMGSQRLLDRPARAAISVKMITRSPACEHVVSVREDRLAVADDRADQRAADRHVAEALADVLALRLVTMSSTS